MSLSNISNCFGRKYKLDLTTSRNFDEYLKITGIPAASRKVAATVQPIVEIVQESDGEEFDEITPDGRKVKSIITLEGNKLIQIQKNGKESVTIREFTPEQVNMTLKIDDVVCTRSYKYVEE